MATEPAAAATATTPEADAAELVKLRAENKTLRADLDASAADVRAANAEARDRRHDLKAKETSLIEMSADRDKYKGLAAIDADGWKAKFESVNGTLRGINHKAEFHKIAAAAGVKDPSKADALFTLTGYKPEADAVDAAALTTLIGTTLTDFPWLKSDAPAGAAVTTTPASEAAKGTPVAGATTAGAGAHGAAAGPGSDRGQSIASSASASPGRTPGRL